MDDYGQSDRPIVPENAANNGGEPAESREGRGRLKGNPRQERSHRMQSRVRLSQALERVRQAAVRDRTARFTSLWHLIATPDYLREAFYTLKRQSAPGIDLETWSSYEAQLEMRLSDLASRLQRGAYRALPVRRVYIPKADGRQRPLGIPTLEDKLVQRAMATVLSAIYETDFHDCSYGFRPGRNPHLALDTLAVGLQRRNLNWVLDADIRSFFDTVDHAWLLRFVEQRIADPRVLRQLRKWLQAGVLEDGQVHMEEHGTPQGGSISPLLANIYLHYAFDNWALRWQGNQTAGDMLIVRYADDLVICFQYKSDAECFLAAMQERLGRFQLTLNLEKTRLLEFGRYAVNTRRVRGVGKPETFDFLGFTHYCGTTLGGRFVVKRKTARKKRLAKLCALAQELRQRMSESIQMMGRWLGQVLQGHYQYYAVPFNLPSLTAFRQRVLRLWQRVLSRRSQKGAVAWKRMAGLASRFLPRPRILHPYPNQRLAL